jgi:hypothetical protein
MNFGTKIVCGAVLSSITMLFGTGCVQYSLRNLQLTATSPIAQVNVERPNSAQSFEIGGAIDYNGGYGLHYQDGPPWTAPDTINAPRSKYNVNWSVPPLKGGLLFNFNTKAPFTFTVNANGSYYNNAFYYDFCAGIGARLSNSIVGSRLFFTAGSRNSDYNALVTYIGSYYGAGDSLIRDKGKSYCPSIGFNGTINTMREYGWLKYFVAPNIQYFYWIYRYSQDIDVRLLWASLSAGVFKEMGPVTVVLATNIISAGVSGFGTENVSSRIINLPDIRLQVMFNSKY